MTDILITTTPTVAGFEIEATLGAVFGLVVRSHDPAGPRADLTRRVPCVDCRRASPAACSRSLFGAEQLAEARDHALARVRENAVALGADAVVSVRFDSSEIGASASEVVAYGTAVRFRPAPESTEPNPWPLHRVELSRR